MRVFKGRMESRQKFSFFGTAYNVLGKEIMDALKGHFVGIQNLDPMSICQIDVDTGLKKYDRFYNFPLKNEREVFIIRDGIDCDYDTKITLIFVSKDRNAIIFCIEKEDSIYEMMDNVFKTVENKFLEKEGENDLRFFLSVLGKSETSEEPLRKRGEKE